MLRNLSYTKYVTFFQKLKKNVRGKFTIAIHLLRKEKKKRSLRGHKRNPMSISSQRQLWSNSLLHSWAEQEPRLPVLPQRAGDGSSNPQRVTNLHISTWKGNKLFYGTAAKQQVWEYFDFCRWEMEKSTLWEWYNLVAHQQTKKAEIFLTEAWRTVEHHLLRRGQFSQKQPESNQKSHSHKGAESLFPSSFICQMEWSSLNALILLKAAVLSTELPPLNRQTLPSQGNLHFWLQIGSSVLLRSHGDPHCFPTLSDAKIKALAARTVDLERASWWVSDAIQPK